MAIEFIFENLWLILGCVLYLAIIFLAFVVFAKADAKKNWGGRTNGTIPFFLSVFWPVALWFFLVDMFYDWLYKKFSEEI